MSESERETWIDGIAAELREPVTLRTDFDTRVMTKIRRESRTPTRGWRCSVTLTPLRIAAATAAILGLMAGSRWLLTGDTNAQRGALPVAAPIVARVSGIESPRATATYRRTVQFVVVAPGAAEVALVGDFNNWDSKATPMRLASKAGMWTVTVPLEVGRYQYAFVINGTEWRSDPTAPAAPVNDFGPRNSIIAVTDRST